MYHWMTSGLCKRFIWWCNLWPQCLRLYNTHLAEFTWAGDSDWLIRASVPRCVGLQEVLWTSAFPVKLLAARSKKTAGDSICVGDSASLPTASSGEQWESAPQVWVYAGIWSLKTRGAGVEMGRKRRKESHQIKTKHRRWIPKKMLLSLKEHHFDDYILIISRSHENKARCARR